MKKLIFSAAIVLILGLAACGEAEKPITKDKTIEDSTTKETTTEPSGNEAEKEGSVELEKQQPTNIVDTSSFTYAHTVEVIDNRSTQNNLLVWIDYSADSDPGMSTLNTLNQAFDFLQLPDVIKTSTVTLAIRVDDIKVAQFNVKPANVDFNNNEIGMANLVVNGSEIEYLNEGVKAFGQTMELWNYGIMELRFQVTQMSGFFYY
ncbi:hypothetical protein [Lysinibacillus sp. NPDC056232]|uniref:hypothetical protein n=1 Tax=Lysinibacillus sp. NPDC056232 TaxID=3345756 RepID=UPI0035E10350